jgi:glutamate--cysteine ligase
VKDQASIEAGDTMPFEAYRQQYTSPERLGLTQAAIAPALASV